MLLFTDGIPAGGFGGVERPRGAISVHARNGDYMLTIADTGRLVTGGVDTHAEMHVAGVADQAAG
jgi:hypothetical protein